MARTRPVMDGLLDALDLGVCALDADGVIVEINQSWLRLLGGAVRLWPSGSSPPAVPRQGGGPGGTQGGDPADDGAPAPSLDGGRPLIGLPFTAWAGCAGPEWADTLAEAVRHVRTALDGGPADTSLHHSAVAGDTVRDLHLRIRRVDGDEEGAPRVLVTAQDVTALTWAHHLSKAQQEERERLELVVRYTDSAIAVLTLDGIIEWVSDTFVALTGFGRDEAVGRPCVELVRGPFVGTEAFGRFAAEIRAGRPASVEAPLHRPDGSLYWVAWAVQPMFQDGRVVKLLSIQRDITKRRRAEEMARQTLVRAQRLGAELRQEKHLVSSVLATVPTGVWWKDADLVHLGCNQAYVALRGLSSTAELIGRTEQHLPVHDAIGPRVDELERRVLDTGEPVTLHRITVAEPGQPMQTFLLSVLPRLENRQRVGVLGMCTDISQMAELERQVSQTSRLESIGQLAAGIAHEINTPVQYASDNVLFVTDSFQSIFDGLRRLQEFCATCTDPAVRQELSDLLTGLDLDFLAEEVPSALAQSQEGLDRVAQIVRAMKEFSHPGGERTPTDVNQVVDSTIQVSRNEWKYVARLEQDLDPTVGQLPCYAGDLKQALLNIIVNAAHAIDERRRRQGTDALGLLTVTTRRTANEVVIAVRDDGIGMEEDVRRRIFDPFFTTKAVGKGTGQGLSLAHSAIVTKHHGRIDVCSEPMAGSVFSIVLPIPAGSGTEAAG